MNRVHIVHRDHFQIVFRNGGILREQLLVQLKLILLAHEQVEEHRILCLTVHAILLHDIKLMLVGIPFRHDFIIRLRIFSHRALPPVHLSDPMPLK